MREKVSQAITTHSLLLMAASIGVSLTEHHYGKKGYYHHPTRTISLRADLSERAYRSTLAHELAHAYYGDEATGVAWVDQRMEARADREAALLLVTPDDYQAAEAHHGPHDDAIAHELGVTTHLIRVWRGIHERKLTP